MLLLLPLLPCLLVVLQKPETWRLACQTIVGDGTNSGTVVIQTKPQAK